MTSGASFLWVPRFFFANMASITTFACA
jgi:hypothetical protein